ncbi:MAG: hypothetical protein ACP5N1_02430 [Candidatus Woesearchaeota archaeon]
MIDLTPQIKDKILKKYNYTCQKCGFRDEFSDEVLVHVMAKDFKDREYGEDLLIVLCKICDKFAPVEEKYFNTYINEKIPSEILDTFRKAIKTTSKRTKKGMQKALLDGKTLGRAPKGYDVVNGKLVINEVEMAIVKKIFEDYKNGISLREIARRYNMSAPGIKKVLENNIYNLK